MRINKIAAGLALRKMNENTDDMSEFEWLHSTAAPAQPRVGKELYDHALEHQRREQQRRQAAAEAKLNHQLEELAAAQARRDEAANHPLSQF